MIMNKIKKFFNNPNWVEPFWSIRAFILQPIVPVVPFSHVVENDGSWNGGSASKDKYVYYQIGNKEVKVKSIEVLRHILNKKELEIIELKEKLGER